MATPTEPERLVTLDDVRRELVAAQAAAYDAYRSGEEAHARIATTAWLLNELGKQWVCAKAE